MVNPIPFEIKEMKSSGFIKFVLGKVDAFVNASFSECFKYDFKIQSIQLHFLIIFLKRVGINSKIPINLYR